jgi:histidyl-tRNA synthetase
MNNQIYQRAHAISHPEEMAKRNYIFDVIKTYMLSMVFSRLKHRLWRPCIRLMGKYGEEGDKLLFKVLNSGDYMS